MIKVNCLERCVSEQKVLDKIDSFNEKFYDYLNRAVAGENPYELEIDKKWANFIYKISKMTFLKMIVILITIAPSFTKIVGIFTTAIMIKGCYLKNDPNTTLALGECIKYNQNLSFVKFNFTGATAIDIAAFVGVILIFALPQLCFIAMIWMRFRINKYTVWISAAKIQLSTLEKRSLTCLYYYLLFCLVFLIYLISQGIAKFNEMFGEGYSVPYNNQTRLVLTFERNNADSPLTLVSTGLIYSCLLTVLFAQIREPMSLFTGFRKYLKKASRVPYNIATVDYRIHRDPITWKFIQRYYQECERYDRRVVLIAMTTHFLDLEILEVEEDPEDNQSSVSIKVE